jgi:hypothetical protein
MNTELRSFLWILGGLCILAGYGPAKDSNHLIGVAGIMILTSLVFTALTMLLIKEWKEQCAERKRRQSH